MGKIQVTKRGRDYLLNGEVAPPREFIGGEAFKGINHIAAWVFGGTDGESGGEHLDRFRRYLELDIVGNGLRRCRLPLELMFWSPPYFDLPSHPNIANTQEWFDLGVGTGSAFRLTSAFTKGLRMAINLAREFDLVFEIVPLWTIKGRGDDDPREDVGAFNEHVVGNEDNGLGVYLHQLKTVGDGEGEHRVDPGGLNLIVDTMNEYTAHSDVWSQSQLQNVARRWHDRDNPGELIFISQSGKRYDPPLATFQGSRGFDGVFLHPPRDGEWTQTGTLARQAWPNELIDFNESMMAWTQEDADHWLQFEELQKWRGLATTDLDAWESMVENFLDNWIYVTLHTKRGMDGAFPESPQSVVEERIRAITGVVLPGPSPPPPGPPPATGLRVVRNDDKELVIERDPEVVHGGDEANVLKDRISVPLPGRKLERLFVFQGRDQDDMTEMDTEIHANGKTLYVRSDHKVTEYDAWTSWDPTDYTEEVKNIEVHVVCRVNGKNGAGKLEARPHWGIRVVWK